MPVVFKFVIFVFIILAPVIFIMVVMGPLAAKKTNDDLLKRYALPVDFSKTEFKSLVTLLKNDAEFKFYFFAMDEKKVEQAIDEVYQLLVSQHTQKGWQQYLEDIKTKVNAHSVHFMHMAIPEDFYEDSELYPTIVKVMDQFLYEEFKLTLVGLSYKSVYDNEFSFQWDEATRLAAQKLQSTIIKIKVAAKKEMI